MNHSSSVTAFDGTRKIAAGDLASVALQLMEQGRHHALIFDDQTANRVELDLRGSSAEVLARLSLPPVPPPPPKPGRGRPKLGVVAREITLLPRHWEWLNSQPGGASVTLRKLVEEARKTHNGDDSIRHSREATYKFLHAIAGDFPHYEEATRALFAGDRAAFEKEIARWPADIITYADQLAKGAWEVSASSAPANGES